MAVFCTSCGKTIEPGLAFCANCGTVAPAQQPGAQQQPGRPPVSQSDRTVALYGQDVAPGAPPRQGAAPAQGAAAPRDQVGFAPKKQAVYPQQSAGSQYPSGPAQAPAPQYAPPAQPYAGPAPYPAAPPAFPPQAGKMDMTQYLINLLIMSIPFAGLVISILWGMTPEPPDKSNLAKAMIVFNAIWMVVFLIIFIVFFNTLSKVADVKVEFGF